MKWCENVVKCWFKDGRIVGFEDLSKFVEFVVEFVNDLIYSKDVFVNIRVKLVLVSGVVDYYKKL